MNKFVIEFWTLTSRKNWDSFRPVGLIGKDNNLIQKNYEDISDSSLMIFDNQFQAQEWTHSEEAKKWKDINGRSSLDVIGWNN